MQPQLIQFSGVVVGDDHNPTILNPDFLSKEGIVPNAWKWEVKDTFTTPAFAMVQYINGVGITVEPNKLQVTDPNMVDGPGTSKVTAIISAYVQTLRHVRYTAVGNNFQSVIQVESPNKYLKTRFLKEGPWNTSARTLDALGVRLIYPLEKGRLTLSIDAGDAKLPDYKDKKLVIIVNANFNRTGNTQPAYEQVTKFLIKTMEDWATYKKLLTSILGGEE